MLFLGDDWAEDHHDVELVDEAGHRMARRRLVEGVAGLAELHALVGSIPNLCGETELRRVC